MAFLWLPFGLDLLNTDAFSEPQSITQLGESTYA